MTRPKIEMLPVPDTSRLYDFQKMMLDRIAAAFALPYHLLAPGPIIRTHLGDIQYSSAWASYEDAAFPALRAIADELACKALNEYHVRYEAICWTYLVGYDPQKLLEHKI